MKTPSLRAKCRKHLPHLPIALFITLVTSWRVLSLDFVAGAYRTMPRQELVLRRAESEAVSSDDNADRRRTLGRVLSSAYLLFVGYKLTRLPKMFIAALADPSAKSGTGAEEWGLWVRDPGPPGVRLGDFPKLQSEGGVAPAGWKFDSKDWWLEEHGLIMEQPAAPLPPGKYTVSGDREVTTTLTILPKEADGTQRWQLGDNAKLYDVTHLPCRSARYTPAKDGGSCLPSQALESDFPVEPGAAMPFVQGCNKQDYAVLFVLEFQP